MSGHHHHGHKKDEWGDFLDHLMSFHYLPAEELKFDFTLQEAVGYPDKVTQLCFKHKAPGVVSRAMDIGCGTGGMTFRLAKGFEEVVGLDISEKFIARCQELKTNGQVEYAVPTEGELKDKKLAVIDPTIDRNRVTFVLGDACNLDPKLRNFGCILATNAVAHLPDAKAFLASAADAIVPGGVLVISEHYSVSPEEVSLGGHYSEEGEEVKGFGVLQKCLSPHFDLIEQLNLPWVSKTNSTMYMLCVTHTTVWKRKA